MDISSLTKKSEAIKSKHGIELPDSKSDINENVNQAMDFSHDVNNLEKMMASKDDEMV